MEPSSMTQDGGCEPVANAPVFDLSATHAAYDPVGCDCTGRLGVRLGSSSQKFPFADSRCPTPQLTTLPLLGLDDCVAGVAAIGVLLSKLFGWAAARGFVLSGSRGKWL